MKSNLLHLFLVLLLCPMLGQARFPQAQMYDEMVANADLVALIQPYRCQAAPDPFPNTSPEMQKNFVALNTDFAVRAVLKATGDVPKYLTVLHFAFSERVNMIFDGPTLIQFLGEDVPESNEPFTSPPGIPQYSAIWLAFLKRRPDGRYEPVAGQVDGAYAFRVLRTFYTYRQWNGTSGTSLASAKGQSSAAREHIRIDKRIYGLAAFALGLVWFCGELGFWLSRSKDSRMVAQLRQSLHEKAMADAEFLRAIDGLRGQMRFRKWRVCLPLAIAIGGGAFLLSNS